MTRHPIAALALLLACTHTISPARADELQVLLLSSAWCSFAFNANTGSREGRRYAFYPDGSFNVVSLSETRNAAQQPGLAQTAIVGHWSTRSNMLYLAVGYAPPIPVDVKVRMAGNGQPVAVVSGQEFVTCR